MRGTPRPGRSGPGVPGGTDLVLLDLVSGKKGRQNDSADQKRNHPMHVAHCFPFLKVGRGIPGDPLSESELVRVEPLNFYPFRKKMQGGQTKKIRPLPTLSR